MADPRDPGEYVGGVYHEESEGETTHHTVATSGSHISWDSDTRGDYIQGSGHTTDHQTGKTDGWDKGTKYDHRSGNFEIDPDKM